jgi:hypothetical protein
VYYVVHPDGSRYGPADLPTLQDWANEGRLVQATTLIDASTGQQMIAGRAPGLVWGHNPAAHPSQATVLPGQMTQTPYGGGAGQINQSPHGGYPRPNQPYGGYSAGRPKSTLGMVALVCGISSILCLCLCMPLGIISGIAGLIAASSARAKGDTNTGWYSALNIGGIALNAILLAIFFALKSKMGGM